MPIMATSMRPLDLVALVVYLAGLAVLAVYFARRNQSTEEYFLGNRSFPGWAIGLSMLGTSISSVTFLAFPADAYQSDWRRLVSNLMLPVVAVVAIVVFIPFFRRGKLTSAFEYLGERFGTLPRLYGTASFVLLQLLRLGTVLYLVSIPVSLLSGASITTVIVLAGLFIGFYTVLGGIDAVIWTDVIQAIVLWLGGLVCVVAIAFSLPGGMRQIFEIAAAHDKFAMGSAPESVAEADDGTKAEQPRAVATERWRERIGRLVGRDTFFTLALLGIFHWLAMYSSDQNVVQRYAASKSTREARKATALYSLLAVPTWTFFFFVGTSVFVYYKVFPDPRVAGLQADEVFPYFILTQIPAGVAGVVIAGVLAAAMSSLDSSINAIATVTVVDVLRPFVFPGRDDRFYLRLARGIATVTAAAMIAGAIVFSRIDKQSMNDVNWIVSSVFGGCLVGLFLVGFFTRRVDGTSAVVALFGAIALNLYLGASAAGWLPERWTVGVHNYWVGILVNVAFVVLALGCSLFRPKSAQRLEGLTVWTLQPAGEEAGGS